jgi:hypothetical protein
MDIEEETSSLKLQLNPTIKGLTTNSVPLIPHSQRFFHLDKTQEAPIIRQFTDQVTEIYQMRRLYLIDQGEFLESLQTRIKTEKNLNLQTLHPWFNEMSPSVIKRILTENIETYYQALKNIDTLPNLLQNSNNTLDSLFVTIMESKFLTLVSRKDRRARGVALPSTKSNQVL